MLTSTAVVVGSSFPACQAGGWGGGVGPGCVLLPPVIWVGGWGYSSADHKTGSYFLKKHIIVVIQDNIPVLPFLLPLATTNGTEPASGKRLLVLGR